MGVTAKIYIVRQYKPESVYVSVSENYTPRELFLCGCKTVERIERSYRNDCASFRSFAWNTWFSL